MEEFIPIHIPVLKDEILSFLNKLEPKDNYWFLDGTAGEGGHSSLILNAFPNSKLILLDRDEEMLGRATKRLEEFKDRIHPVLTNFSEITREEILKITVNQEIDGLILDLGISTYHIMSSGRGFTYREDEYLDMRLEKTNRLTAFEVVNRYSQKDLFRIFKEYGEENWSKKIAEVLVDVRKKQKIQTTGELAKLIERIIPRKFWPDKMHPALRIFQALRIEVNNELKSIAEGLPELSKVVSPGGIMSVISFHSLEDRIVKNFMKSKSLQKDFVILTKKPIIPTEPEMKANPASRSAKLRAIQRISTRGNS